MTSNLLKIGTKIICVWRNYAAHTKDLGNAVPKEPVLFMKPTSSYLEYGGTIKIPEPDRPQDPALSPDPHHGEIKTYIVYMGDKPKSEFFAIQKYKTMISNILGKNATDALLCTYTKAFSGFAVRMNEEQKNLMKKVHGKEIVSIFESQRRQDCAIRPRTRNFMRIPPTLSNYSSTEGVVYRKPPFQQLFKESGNFNKNFQSPDKAVEKPTPERTRSPTNASCMFSGTDKCATCGKTAYPLEKVTVESQAYHKTCFKCSHGGCALSPSN